MRERTLKIAIDPGLKGGMAVAYKNKLSFLEPLGKNPKEILKTCIDAGLTMQKYDNLEVFIEDVHSMPGMRSQSVFTFGRNLGHIEAVLSTLGLPDPLRINPRTWQKYFELSRDSKVEARDKWKQRLLKEAIKRAPSDEWKDKMTLYTCDAFLILLYSLRENEEK